LNILSLKVFGSCAKLGKGETFEVFRMKMMQNGNFSSPYITGKCNVYVHFFSGYYKIGESMSSRPEALQIRELDMKMWKQEGKISSDA